MKVLISVMLLRLTINKVEVTCNSNETSYETMMETKSNYNTEIYDEENLYMYDSFVRFNSEINGYEIIEEKADELTDDIYQKINIRIDATNEIIRNNNLTEKDLQENLTKEKKNVPKITWYGVYWHMSQKH